MNPSPSFAPRINGTIINAMTVDVEDYMHVSAFASMIRRDDWDRYELRVERNFVTGFIR